MKNDTEHRLTKLETEIAEIKNNHLPHIQKTVDKILWWIIGGFTTVFGALLIHGLLTFLQAK